MKDIYDLILFVGGAYAYAPKRIAQEADKKGLKYLVVPYKDLTFAILEGKFEVGLGDESLPQAKGVFLRALGEATVYNALKNGIIEWYKKDRTKLLNLASFDKWVSLDKTTQYLEFKAAGIPIVESFFFGSKNQMLEWGKNQEYPIIVKQNVGSLGTGVYKINSFEELEGLLEKYTIFTVKTLLVQRFLAGGEDLRVIVLGGKCLGAMKRIAQEGQYLTNYSQGGMVEKYDLENDAEAQRIALEVAKHFKLDYCGVDLMKAKDGGWKVLEVNRACQFKGFESSTGYNVASQIVDYLTK